MRSAWLSKLRFKRVKMPKKGKDSRKLKRIMHRRDLKSSEKRLLISARRKRLHKGSGGKEQRKILAKIKRKP